MVKIDKEVLFELVWSHGMLLTDQIRLGFIGEEHPARGAEIKMAEALGESGWLEEYVKWRRGK